MSIPAARCLGLFVTQVVAGQLIPAARCHREEAAGARSGGRQAATAPAQSTPIFLKSSRFRKRLETTQNSIKRFMLCKHYTYFKHWSNIYLTYHSPSFMPWLGYLWYASQGDHWITITMYNDHNSQPSWLTPQHTLVFHFQDCFAIGIYNPVISPRVWHVFSRPFPWMWRWSCHSCKRKWLAYHR